MSKYLLFSFLLLAAGCAQTQGLNTARVNVDQYNRNQMDRLKASGLIDKAGQNDAKADPDETAAKDTPENILAAPVSDPEKRVTKKPFGIKIDPRTSPVRPERFSGYHTGVDFEVLPGEETADVPVFAICQGPLIQKLSASGYGGVAVQSCALDGAPITVVYGHLRLASIKAEIGKDLKPGLQFAVLGKGYSAETDNERAHLHLGIHKGEGINLLGYVENEAGLDNWLDIMEYLE